MRGSSPWATRRSTSRKTCSAIQCSPVCGLASHLLLASFSVRYCRSDDCSVPGRGIEENEPGMFPPIGAHPCVCRRSLLQIMKGTSLPEQIGAGKARSRSSLSSCGQKSSVIDWFPGRIFCAHATLVQGSHTMLRSDVHQAGRRAGRATGAEMVSMMAGWYQAKTRSNQVSLAKKRRYISTHGIKMSISPTDEPLLSDLVSLTSLRE